MQKIILGSGSPRRAEILKMAGYAIEIRKSDVEEIVEEGTSVYETASYLAKLKASALKTSLNVDDLLLTADTVIILEGKLLGKPKDRVEAKNMLTALSGNTHTVITGVTIIKGNKEITFSDTTEVTFSDLDEEMIEYYIENFTPFDKAGAYGVQEFLGMVAVKKMNGSFYNVMGLPIHKVYESLKQFK